jgi:hypothetical protein
MQQLRAGVQDDEMCEIIKQLFEKGLPQSIRIGFAMTNVLMQIILWYFAEVFGSIDIARGIKSP